MSKKRNVVLIFVDQLRPDFIGPYGADFIKTSTGFSKSGATREAVSLMRAHVGRDVCVKAAGGIASLEDAEDFITLGADRLGTSRVVKIVKAQNNDNNQGGY